MSNLSCPQISDTLWLYGDFKYTVDYWSALLCSQLGLLKSCFCKVSPLYNSCDPFTSCSEERVHPLFLLWITKEEHLMWGKDEKRDEASLLKERLISVLEGTCGTLNANLSYCHSLKLFSLDNQWKMSEVF